MTGLAPDEARAYRALLRSPTASVGDLAVRLGVSAADVHACLDRLEAHGLVRRLPGTDQRFRATPPDRAFEPLIRRRRDELRNIRADVEALASAYVRDVSQRGGDQMVEVLHGAAARDYACRATDAATSDVSALVVGTAWDLAPWPTETHAQHRRVYARAVLTNPAVQADLNKAIATDQIVRVADRLSLNLLVVDRSLALLPVRAVARDHDGVGDVEHRRAVLVVHPGGLLDGLLALFERTWAVAAGLLICDDGVVREDPAVTTPGPEDLRLLELLVDGLTDDAVASRLDVGTRTVQRRVRDLIELAGVRTRLQLIWEATRRGWI